MFADVAPRKLDMYSKKSLHLFKCVAPRVYLMCLQSAPLLECGPRRVSTPLPG